MQTKSIELEILLFSVESPCSNRKEEKMWELDTSWIEMVLRSLVVYGLVFLLFRLIGKKQLGEFSPFDFVLVLIVSEGISQGLTGEEHSVTGAAISAATLLGINRVFDYFAFKSRRFEKIMDGESRIIVENGKICEKVRVSECITTDELMSALREHEIENLSDLKFAILETNGRITVIKKA